MEWAENDYTVLSDLVDKSLGNEDEEHNSNDSNGGYQPDGGGEPCGSSLDKKNLLQSYLGRLMGKYSSLILMKKSHC